MAPPRQSSITQLGKDDVLIGRGTGPNLNDGNIRFRELVSARKTEYLAINPRDHKNKNRIAREIVAVVRSRGGRFLKRIGTVAGTEPIYETVDEETVLEKAKQALRQNRAKAVAQKSPNPAAAPAEIESAAWTKSTPSANIDVGHQTNMVAGATRLPPPFDPKDPYQAFMAHLQQPPCANVMSPAETRIRNIQALSYAAQQDHQPPHSQQANTKHQPNTNGPSPRGGAGHDRHQYENVIRNLRVQDYVSQQQRNSALQANTMPPQNPHAASAERGSDLSQYREAIAWQQYKSRQQHSAPNTSMAIGQDHYSSTAAGKSDSEYMRFLMEQQMKQNLHVSEFGRHIGNQQHCVPDIPMSMEPTGGTDSDFIRYQLKHQMKKSLQNVLRGSNDLVSGGKEPCENPPKSASKTGASISDAQMKALENLFVNASQSTHGHDSMARFRDENGKRSLSESPLESSAHRSPLLRPDSGVGGATVDTKTDIRMSDSTKFAVDQGRMKHHMRNVTQFGGQNASILPGREAAAKSAANYNTSNGQLPSESQMKFLEALFVSTGNARHLLPQNTLNAHSGSNPHHRVIYENPVHTKSKRIRGLSDDPSAVPQHRITAESMGRIITKLNKFDVVCGRGLHMHNSNVHFIDLVFVFKAEHATSDHMNRNRITKEIITTVRNRGGRFLKMVPTKLGQDEVKVYYELADESTVLETVKQALQSEDNGSKESNDRRYTDRYECVPITRYRYDSSIGTKDHSKDKSMHFNRGEIVEVEALSFDSAKMRGKLNKIQAKRKAPFLTGLNEYDVLCGRGNGPIKHAGNTHFFDLVSSCRAEYLATSTNDHKNKDGIASEIIRTVRYRGGRFLIRVDVKHEPGSEKPDMYELADEEMVLEKVKKTLRKHRDASGRTLSPVTSNID